jgi:hypothetical protein
LDHRREGTSRVHADSINPDIRHVGALVFRP